MLYHSCYSLQFFNIPCAQIAWKFIATTHGNIYVTIRVGKKRRIIFLWLVRHFAFNVAFTCVMCAALTKARFVIWSAAGHFKWNCYVMLTNVLFYECPLLRPVTLFPSPWFTSTRITTCLMSQIAIILFKITQTCCDSFSQSQNIVTELSLQAWKYNFVAYHIECNGLLVVVCVCDYFHIYRELLENGICCPTLCLFPTQTTWAVGIGKCMIP